jgi:hypothetical protein
LEDQTDVSLDDILNGTCSRTQPTLEMQERWLKTLNKKSVPKMDIQAQLCLLTGEKPTR